MSKEQIKDNERGIVLLANPYAERYLALEMFHKICRSKGITVKTLDYPLRRGVTFFSDLSLMFVALNYTEAQLTAMIEFLSNLR